MVRSEGDARAAFLYDVSATFIAGRLATPFHWVVREAQAYVSPFAGWMARLPVGAGAMFDGYNSFLDGIVAANGYEPLLSLLEPTFRMPGLVPQYAHMGAEGCPTAMLLDAPRNVDIERVRALLGEWRALAGDWDQFTKVPYGLLQIGLHGSCTWDEAGKFPLGRRLREIRTIPNLAAVVPDTWLTIRNALQHGHAAPNPSTRTVEFHDERHSVSLSYRQLRGQMLRMSFVNVMISKTLLHGMALHLLRNTRKWPSVGSRG